MKLEDFIASLTPEERAAYEAIVAKARGAAPDEKELRKRLAQLVIAVQKRREEKTNPGPILDAFWDRYLPVPEAMPLSDLVHHLPYPLARKVQDVLVGEKRRAEGEEMPLFRQNLCAAMGILVRLAAVIGIQSYVRIAEASDAEINRDVVRALREPTDGKWLELAHRLVRAVGDREDAPLARKTRAALTNNTEVADLDVPHVLEALNHLITYRNRLVHGRLTAENEKPETERAVRLLRTAVRAFDFLADYDLLVRREEKIFRLRGVLPEEIESSPANLPEEEPCLVHRAGDEPPLSLAPLLVFREGAPHGVVEFDELFFLNAGAAERLSYIAYRYARHLSGRDLGAYEAFRRFLRTIPAPRIPPDPRIDYDDLAEEHGRHFVGREDVLAAIEAFVAERPAPYGVIEALGGMGKTALFTRLYEKHKPLADEPPEAGDRWAFHFCMRQGGRDNAVVALRSLIAQICDGFGFDRRSYLSNDLEVLQANLAALVEEAGEHLTEGERLVLAVDALDEGVSESPRDRIPSVLPGQVPEHAVVLVSYRVDEDSRNTRVERHLAHVPSADRHALALANPLAGLTRENVATYLKNLNEQNQKKGAVPESTLEAVMDAADYGGEGADPFYLRFVADGVEAGRIDLARSETVPASLEEAFDDLWMRLPTDRDFLVHRILGLLAVMQDYGDDDLFAYLLGPEQPEGEEPLTSLEVASLRAQAGKLLVYDGDRYGLFHDRFRHYLIGESAEEDEEWPVAEPA